MIRVGIIGCGKIAQVRHLPEYEQNPLSQIVGLYDLNTERTQQLAKQYGAKVYDSYEALLADETIEAVSICSANHSHAQIAIAALQAGKHVLCEKPMATNLADCEAMVAEAKCNERYLMIGQNQRLAGAHQKAKALLDQKEIGDIITFQTRFSHGGPETWTVDGGKNIWFFDKTKASMGVLADLGIHKTDLISYLLGEEITSVSARLVTLDKRDANGDFISVDDNAFCIYQMASGACGTMTASWTNYGKVEENATVLYGTKGVMRIYDDPDHAIVIQKDDGSVIYHDEDKIQSNDAQTSSGVIDLFLACVQDPSRSELDGESVLKAMRAVFAGIESAQTGQTVICSEVK